MSDPLDDYLILSIRDGESVVDPLYPIPGGWADTVELDEEDGEPLDPVGVGSMIVSVLLQGGRTRKLAEVSGIKADLIVTKSRAAVACSKYEKGGGWRGFGAGAAIAIAANAGSMAMAAYRRRGKMLVGHVPFEHLIAVGWMPARSRRHLDQLRLMARYRRENGGYKTLVFDLALTKGGLGGQFMARQIVWWASRRRLDQEADLLDQEGRNKLERLLEADPLPAPEEDLKFSLYYLPGITDSGPVADEGTAPAAVPPAAAPRVEPEAADLEELRAAIEAVEGIDDIPSGDVRADPAIDRLWREVNRQIAVGAYRWAPKLTADAQLIWDAREATEGLSGSILEVIALCDRDHGIVDQQVDGVKVERVIWADSIADYPELGIQIQKVEGTYTPIPTLADENWVVGMVCELELLVEAIPGQRATLEAVERPLSSWELYGVMRSHYELRRFRRLAIGSGVCVLTDQRVIGMIQTNDDPPLPDGPEKMAMPHAIIDNDLDLASCVVFIVERDQFSIQGDLEGEGGATARWLQARASNVALLGDHVHLKLQPYRVIEAERIRKPRKGEILGTVRDYLPPEE